MCFNSFTQVWRTMERKTKIYLSGGVLLTVMILIAAIWLVRSIQSSEVSLESDDRIQVTPELIESIKAIGQWEFRAVSDEQLVDTIRKGIFSDDHLVRIYYGTVRLGIDMQKTSDNWLQVTGDSLTALLPPITLLDPDFIDEARTRSFHESGRWKPEDREALFHRAKRQMLRRCMAKENIESARQNGETQFRQMMQSFGFNHVSVHWER